MACHAGPHSENGTGCFQSTYTNMKRIESATMRGIAQLCSSCTVLLALSLGISSVPSLIQTTGTGAFVVKKSPRVPLRAGQAIGTGKAADWGHASLALAPPGTDVPVLLPVGRTSEHSPPSVAVNKAVGLPLERAPPSA
jgi:hypothetical protein